MADGSINSAKVFWFEVEMHFKVYLEMEEVSIHLLGVGLN